MRGYLALLRRNPDFARLWLAQVVSLVGDWFALVLLLVVVSARSGGSGLAISLSVLAEVLPYVVVGPWSGILADRFDRRRLMVASDLGRAFIVLGFLAALGAPSLWPLYGLTFLQFSISTLFEPARAALMPHLVSERDLLAASTLTNITWSAMAAGGALLAGAAVSLVGTTGAFLIDALSFLLSAAILASMAKRPVCAAGRTGRTQSIGVRPALAWLRRHPVTGAALLVKTMNGLAVFDTFLVVIGTQLFPLGERGSLSTGLLFTGIGLGAVTGPQLLNRWNDGSVPRMRRLVALSSWCLALGMAVLASAPLLAFALLGAFLRAFGGSCNWTYSTVILQKSVPDALRGRVFALDFASAHLVAGSSALAAGWAIDRFGVRAAAAMVALLGVLPALAWVSGLDAMDRREARAALAGEAAA